MRSRPRILNAVTAGLVAAGATTGCAAPDGGDWAPPPQPEPQYSQPYEPPAEPSYAPPAPRYEPPPPPPPAGWRCRYSPTMNYDWHDDALCSNGTDSIRPYLREWDSFVTEDELMESARDYEQDLNGA